MSKKQWAGAMPAVQFRVARPTNQLAEVEPENPYWKQKGITIADPDGYRIVLQNTSGLS